MEWYYAEANERRGPVTEAQFNELIRSGRLGASTQVWRAGWTDWRPLSEAGLSTTGDAAVSAPCVECGRVFPIGEMVQYENSWVCPACKPVFFQKVREGVEASADLVYAGFWIRFVAKFLDGIIVGIPGYALQFGGAALMPTEDAAGVGFWIGWFASMLLNVAYATFLVGKYGATVGKMACGLRVVTPDGGKVGYGVACGRFFAEILSGLILYIGYIMAAFDEEKRSLHDRICNTRVIRRRA